MTETLKTDAAQKPRRGVLYAIIIAVLLIVAAFSIAWFVVAQKAGDALYAYKNEKVAGRVFRFSSFEIGGFPFRMYVHLKDFHFENGVGDDVHGIEAPVLEAEAIVFDPQKWVAVAPQGLSLLRGPKGPVNITGEAMRASVSNILGKTPSFALELRNVKFDLAPGAAPFPIASADLIDAYMRPGDTADHRDALLRLRAATPRVGGPLEFLARGSKLDLDLEGKTSPDFQAIKEVKGQARFNGFNIDIKDGGMTTRKDGAIQGQATLVPAWGGGVLGWLMHTVLPAYTFHFGPKDSGTNVPLPQVGNGPAKTPPPAAAAKPAAEEDAQ